MRLGNYCLILTTLFLCVNGAVAAERTSNAVARQTIKNEAISTSRNAQTKTITSRVAAKDSRNQSASVRTATKTVVGRSANQRSVATRTATNPTRISRAATSVKTRTFGTNYNSCRDAYFTCMDQFCATLNENYRRINH